MILELAIVGIMIFLFNYFFSRRLEEKGIVERTFGIILLIVSDIFLVVYYVDRFNLPTILAMNTNVSTQNWLMIITTGASTIIASTIGGIIAFGVARNQIEQNEEQNKENNRIQNMPLIQYHIESRFINNGIEEEEIIQSNTEDEHAELFSICFFIKNIGMNSAKQVKMDFISSFISDKLRILGNNTQKPLAKDEEIEIRRFFRLGREQEYPIFLNVYYEDVLQNWYVQEVEIQFKTPKTNEAPEASVKFTVKEEKKVKKEEICL